MSEATKTLGNPYLLIRGSPVFHLLQGDSSELLTWCGQSAGEGFLRHSAIALPEAPSGFRVCKNCDRMHARGFHKSERNQTKADAWDAIKYPKWALQQAQRKSIATNHHQQERNVSETKPARVYISGPMSGLPDLNFPAFNAAAQQLRELGLDAVNPADITPTPA